MKIALFLHAYQPPTQLPHVTEEINQQSYLPILKTLRAHPKSRLTMNFSGSLTEQLSTLELEETFENIRYLVGQGQLELVGTAAYHPLLTYISDEEIRRQDLINRTINIGGFGEENFQPQGFFVPEMVYNRHVAEVISGAGYKWIILDESAHPDAGIEHTADEDHYKLHLGNCLNKVNGLPMYVFFRDRPISLRVAFEHDTDINDFVDQLTRHYGLGDENYIVIAVDAETFGHHNPSNLDFLSELMEHPATEMVKISELMSFGYDETEIEPTRSTWGIAYEDENQERTFPYWSNPENPVHKLMWKLFDLAISCGSHVDPVQPDVLDKAMHSDQFWWASNIPFWLPVMTMAGVDLLVESIRKGKGSSQSVIQEAKQLRARIEEEVDKIGRTAVTKSL